MNVAERREFSALGDVRQWLDHFEVALRTRDADGAADLFVADGLWRDVLAFTWTIETETGHAAIAAMLHNRLAVTQPHNFHIPSQRTPPRWVTRAGKEALECLFGFETAFGPGAGVLRLVLDGRQLCAWTLTTTLEQLRGHEEAFTRRAIEANHGIRDFGADNWADRLAKAREYQNRDPTVIVVGGGQAGLSIAARLSQLGVDTLIIDRHKRIGDNWRKRYHSLTLHNEVYVNHLPFLPFPPTFPVYIPKDRLANWFEHYVEVLELNFWTGTELAGGSYDADNRRWSLRLKRS